MPSQRNVNLRVGIEHREFDINVFVENLTNEHNGVLTGGRNGCTNASCSTFLNYNIERTVAARTIFPSMGRNRTLPRGDW